MKILSFFSFLRILGTAFFGLALLSACHKKSSEEKWVEQQMPVPEVDIQLPQKVWTFIAGEESPVEGAVLKTTTGVIAFVPLIVELFEKSPGVLVSPQIRIRFPNGGGALDLSRYLTEVDGSFFVRVIYDPEMVHENVDAYFVSRTKKRKIDDESWGAGCKSFFQLGGYFAKTLSTTGVLVNKTRLRHLTLLGGTFVFSVNDGKQMRLSQVTFTDARHPEYFCNDKAPGVGVIND
jgi:hypothetical protein